MAIFEYTESFDYPAEAVYAVIADLAARPGWIGGIQRAEVSPEGPAQLGTRYHETGKFAGFTSEKTLVVTDCQPGRLLTLMTPDGAKAPWRESYRIEPLSEQACRVHFTTEAGNVPKAGEFFMGKAMKKEQPKQTERLKSILASQTTTPH
jgi:ribosome-associated toxin RatA of RatAB toxin-antitoxin module